MIKIDSFGGAQVSGIFSLLTGVVSWSVCCVCVYVCVRYVCLCVCSYVFMCVDVCTLVPSTFTLLCGLSVCTDLPI